MLGNPDWETKFIGYTSPGELTTFFNSTSYVSFDIAGSTKTPGTKTLSGDIVRQRFTYTTLPSDNNEFGNKVVTMQCTAPISTTQAARVQVFFARAASNHPDPDMPKKAGAPRTPNWYYYWTKAVFGAPDANQFYGGPNGIATGLTYFSGGLWISEIYDAASTQSGSGAYGGAEGIEFFADLVYHERKHRQDMGGWWPSGWVSADDLDADNVPNRTTNEERDLTPSSHDPTYQKYNPTIAASVDDDTHYGPVGFNDGEDYCMHTQTVAAGGSLDKLDWAKPGKQWR